MKKDLMVTWSPDHWEWLESANKVRRHELRKSYKGRVTAVLEDGLVEVYWNKMLIKMDDHGPILLHFPKNLEPA